MSRINRVPFGLQDLLGSQNFGDNPSELGQVVLPSLDMSMFLTAERTSWHYESDTFSNNGQVSTVVVPDGEIWYLLGMGARVKPGSGTPSSAFGINIDWLLTDLPTSSGPTFNHAICGFEFRNETPAALTTESFQGKGFEFSTPIPAFSGTSIICIASGMFGDNNWTAHQAIRYIKAKQ